MVLIALGLNGCGEQAADNEAEVVTQPTSYYVGKVDLYRETPNDICRAKDATVLETLIGRITRSLPMGTTWTDFEDFNAHPAAKGNGMEAVLRFHASVDGAAPKMMYAVGSLNPANCYVEKMKGGIGVDPNDPRAIPLFDVQS